MKFKIFDPNSPNRELESTKCFLRGDGKFFYLEPMDNELELLPNPVDVIFERNCPFEVCDLTENSTH